MLTSNRIAEVIYFYSIYIEKNFSNRFFYCLKEGKYISIKSDLKESNHENTEVEVNLVKSELIKMIVKALMEKT